MNKGSKSRKAREKVPAPCPFEISYTSGRSVAEQQRRKSRKRKRDNQDDDEPVQVQTFPFAATGSCQTHDTMDLYYTITSGKEWQDMTRYNSFIRKYPMRSRPLLNCERAMANS
jgi:hypothetical protein